MILDTAAAILVYIYVCINLHTTHTHIIFNNIHITSNIIIYYNINFNNYFFFSFLLLLLLLLLLLPCGVMIQEKQLLGHPGDGITEHDTSNYVDLNA